MHNYVLLSSTVKFLQFFQFSGQPLSVLARGSACYPWPSAGDSMRFLPLLNKAESTSWQEDGLLIL